MATYSKLYKAETDVPIGFQSVNQARDNLEALRDMMVVEHAYGVAPTSHGLSGRSGVVLTPPMAIPGHKVLGHHNDTRIQRGVAYVSFLAPANGISSPYLQWSSFAVAGVSRLSAGSYFLSATGLSVYWAQVTVYQTSATPRRFGQVRPFYPPSGSPGVPGLFVQTYDLASGAFDLADSIDFSVHVYGHLG